jgi:hypothetical protein
VSHLRTKLFNRSNRKLVLTDAARPTGFCRSTSAAFLDFGARRLKRIFAECELPAF